ncbi:MAG: CAP domain-containing protein [Spirochaetia bacterium]|nr:CAP domain-containing protein [Spirochaetia bacterium]
MKNILLAIIPLLFLSASLRDSGYIAVLEKEVLSQVNAQRLKNGLSVLKTSVKLSSVARAHSKDMAENGYTSHISPEGVDPSTRAKNAGFNIRKPFKGGYRNGVGENIYEHQAVMEQDGLQTPYLEPAKEVAKKAVDGWMQSPGHRKNILNPDYMICGTGAAISTDKKIKITQVFF